MAKKEDNKKEKSGKKGLMAIITAILVPILIIVLIASSFFAIITAIVEFIMTVIADFFRELGDFFTNPLEWIQEQWATFTNWLRNIRVGYKIWRGTIQ